MAIKSIFKALVIVILIITILDCSYADTGPQVGPNQAKTIAQNYLNTYNLPYTAVTPNLDAWKYKAKDTKTGEVKWMSISEWKNYEFNEPTNASIEYLNRYKSISNYSAWVVKVNDKDRKNIGQIYVDDTTGKILKVTVPQQKSQTKASKPTNTTNVTNTTNGTVPISQGSSGNNTGLIYGIIALIIAIGAGYLIYTRI